MELAFRESLKKMRGTKSKEKFSQELEMSRSNYSYHQSIKEVETRNLVKYLITLLIRYLNICKPIISGF